MEGLPGHALESPAALTDSHLSTSPSQQQRRPAEERGGSAATAMGKCLWLASPGSSLEQPKAHVPGGDRDRAPSPWWRGGDLPRAVPGPPKSYHCGPAVRPPPSPSSQPFQPLSSIQCVECVVDGWFTPSPGPCSDLRTSMSTLKHSTLSVLNRYADLQMCCSKCNTLWRT